MADGKIPNLGKSIDDIRAELFARIEEVQDEYQEKGWLPARLNLNKGIVRGILELVCWMIWQLYQVLNTIYRQAVPLEASGEWLDVHAVQVGVSRKAELRAAGNVTFSRPEGADTDRNIPIPAGTIVRTLPDGKGEVFRYVTTADAVLPAGGESVAAPAQSETYGAAANAGTGQICEIVTPVDGVGGVANKADWLTLEGADVENDASLRKRYRLAWMAQAGNTRAAYEAAALSVPGVADVKVADQHPRGEGTLDIIVQGTAGIPTAKLLEDVRAAVADTIIINDDVLVKAPTAHPVTITCTLELLSGDADGLAAQARAWLTGLFAGGAGDGSAAFGVGVDVIRDRLAQGIISLPGVKRIVWTSPAEDIVIAPDELATLESLVVNTTWAEDE